MNAEQPSTTVKPAMRVDVYSHFFKVSCYNDELKYDLAQYSRGLGHYNLQRIGPRQFARVITAVYAARTIDKREFRFHINLWDQFERFMSNRNITEDKMLIVKHDLYEPDLVTFDKLITHQPLRDYQVPQVEYMVAPGRTKIITAQTGRGKALAVSTPVATPEGWVPLSAIKDGDWVLTPNGEKTRVLDVYPQGLTPAYRLTTEDGRWVDCCPEHLWRAWIVPHSDPFLLDTAHLHKSLADGMVLAIQSVQPDPNSHTSQAATNLINNAVRLHGHQRPLGSTSLKYIGGVAAAFSPLTEITIVHHDYGYIQGLQHAAFSIGKTAVISKLVGLDEAGLSRDRFILTITESQWLYIKSIEPVGAIQTKCIRVEHPDGLFVVKDYLVTHNTFMAHNAVAMMGYRTALVVKGGFVEQWVKTTKETLGLKNDELMVVRGSKDLKALIDIALAGELKAKFIIITSKTMFNYYKEYEEATSADAFDYGCQPEDFYHVLGVGVRLIDEVHMEFHANFRQDLYTHVPKTISMTATLEADDPFINRMYTVMFPPECRPDMVEYDRYIEVIALAYKLSDPRVRYMGTNKMYSHIALEQSILRHKDLLTKYCTMIAEIAHRQFIEVFEPGQKLLIFCTTVDMCKAVVEFMRRRYPDVRIGKYTQEDDFKMLEQQDITVSTLKSAGTAVDVSGLRACLMTDNVSSKQANVQAVGRLRRLKDWPDVTPQFMYLYAYNVEKHRQYNLEKREKLRGKVLSHKDLITSYHL